MSIVHSTGEVAVDQSSSVYTHPGARLVNPDDLSGIRGTVKEVDANALKSTSQRNEGIFAVILTVALIAAAIFAGVATHGVGIAIVLGSLALITAFKAGVNFYNYSDKKKQDEVVDNATDYKLSQFLAAKPLASSQRREHDRYDREEVEMMPRGRYYRGERDEAPQDIWGALA